MDVVEIAVANVVKLVADVVDAELAAVVVEIVVVVAAAVVYVQFADFELLAEPIAVRAVAVVALDVGVGVGVVAVVSAFVVLFVKLLWM